MGWEDWSRKLEQTGREVSAKVKETSEVIRLRQKKSASEAELQKTYAAIGQAYCESCDGVVIREDMIPLFEKVNELKLDIAELQSSINVIRRSKICPECGEPMDEASAFCSSCGAKLD